jgi:hypothetical protein
MAKTPGSGRRKGTPNKRTEYRKAIAETALEAGITPLELMLELMRERYAAGDKEGAWQVAKDAAQYCHPKLATTAVAVSGPTHEQWLEELWQEEQRAGKSDSAATMQASTA